MSTLWHQSLYTPLNSKKNELRLLSVNRLRTSTAFIDCDVETFELNRAPCFDALSYIWGDPSLVEEIRFCKLQRRVTTNLFEALKRLQEQTDSKFVWIDALCINQDDETEKNHQVTLMRRIYRSADRVFSWLGPSDTSTHLAFSLVERWADAILATNPTAETWSNSQVRREAVRTIKQPFDQQGWASFVALAQKPYWERIWILQEVTLARRCILLCGNEELMFEKLMWAYRAWTTGSLQSPQLAELIKPVGEGTPFYSFMNVPLENGAFVKVKVKLSAQRELREFPFLLKRASILLATDPKDKVYGILGLLDLASGQIPVNYKSDVVSAYSDTLLTLAKEAGRLDVLSFAGALGVTTQNTATHSWPSWVPNFACLDRRDMDARFSESSLYYDIFFFNASGDSVAQCSMDVTNSRLLHVRGLLLDTISEVVQPFLPQYGESRFCSWLSFTVRHEDKIQPRSISPLQLLFRTMIADHLWRGHESPDFLAPHLGVNFFRFAAGFLLAISTVLENGSTANQPPKISPEVRQTLNSWLHYNVYLDKKDRSTRPHIKSDKFLNQPHLSWPDVVDMYNHSYNQVYLTEFHQVFSRTESRCLFITDNGYLGAEPGSAKVGDKIFLPLGCSVPLIIRPTGTRYEVVADAFVAGVMQGEKFSGHQFRSVNLMNVVLQ